MNEIRQLPLELYDDSDQLTLVHPDMAVGIWSEIVGFIKAANDTGGGKYHPNHWLARVLYGQTDLFVNEDNTTAVIAEPQIFPTGKKVYVIVLMGSEGGCNWDSFGCDLEARAKNLGCHSIEIFGRKGWKKILETRGVKFAHMVWRKELM